MKPLFYGIRRSRMVNDQGYVEKEWDRWISTSLVPAVNATTPLTIPGPYATDAAAASAGVARGSLYYDASGVPHVRIV